MKKQIWTFQHVAAPHHAHGRLCFIKWMQKHLLPHAPLLCDSASPPSDGAGSLRLNLGWTVNLLLFSSDALCPKVQLQKVMQFQPGSLGRLLLGTQLSAMRGHATWTGQYWVIQSTELTAFLESSQSRYQTCE